MSSLWMPRQVGGVCVWGVCVCVCVWEFVNVFSRSTFVIFYFPFPQQNLLCRSPRRSSSWSHSHDQCEETDTHTIAYIHSKTLLVIKRVDVSYRNLLFVKCHNAWVKPKAESSMSLSSQNFRYHANTECVMIITVHITLPETWKCFACEYSDISQLVQGHRSKLYECIVNTCITDPVWDIQG